MDSNWLGLILANKAENIGVTGRGVIDGQGRETSYNYIDQIQKGVIKDELKYEYFQMEHTVRHVIQDEQEHISEIKLLLGI